MLAPEFKIRVELRQIGTREAARVIGGVGSCGRELCCKTHLSNFDFVTMKWLKNKEWLSIQIKLVVFVIS